MKTKSTRKYQVGQSDLRMGYFLDNLNTYSLV